MNSQLTSCWCQLSPRIPGNGWVPKEEKLIFNLWASLHREIEKYPLQYRGGLENGVYQPETFQIWCNCVAVTQESRGLPPQGGVGGRLAGKSGRNQGVPGAPTDLSNFILQTRFLPRQLKPSARVTGRSDLTQLPHWEMLLQLSPPPLPSQVMWGLQQRPRGKNTAPHTLQMPAARTLLLLNLRHVGSTSWLQWGCCFPSPTLQHLSPGCFEGGGGRPNQSPRGFCYMLAD